MGDQYPVPTPEELQALNLFAEGCQLLRQSKFQDALDMLLQAKELDPNIKDLHRCIGWALLNLKRYSEAFVELEQATANEPRNAQAYCNLASYYVAAEQYVAAKTIVNQGLTKLPEDPDLVFSLGHIDFYNGEVGQARMEFQRVVKVAPNHQMALWYLGECCYKLHLTLLRP